eukprot:g735.t1
MKYMHKFLRRSNYAPLYDIGDDAPAIFFEIWYTSADSRIRAKAGEVAREMLTKLSRRLLRETSDPRITPNRDDFFALMFLARMRREMGDERECEALLERADESWAARGFADTNILFGVEKDNLSGVGTEPWLVLLMRLLIMEYNGLLFPRRYPLQWGMREALLALRSLKLDGPGEPDFHHSFYLATHIVYALSAYCSIKTTEKDCPWLFRYLRVSMMHWMKQGWRRQRVMRSAAARAAAEEESDEDNEDNEDNDEDEDNEDNDDNDEDNQEEEEGGGNSSSGSGGGVSNETEEKKEGGEDSSGSEDGGERKARDKEPQKEEDDDRREEEEEEGEEKQQVQEEAEEENDGCQRKDEAISAAAPIAAPASAPASANPSKDAADGDADAAAQKRARRKMTDQELAEACDKDFKYVHVDVDGVSEIVDNLRGCGLTASSDRMVCEGSLWLLHVQRRNGSWPFWTHKGAGRAGGKEVGNYDLLHPSWVAVQALRDRDFKLDRPEAEKWKHWITRLTRETNFATYEHDVSWNRAPSKSSAGGGRAVRSKLKAAAAAARAVAAMKAAGARG